MVDYGVDMPSAAEIVESIFSKITSKEHVPLIEQDRHRQALLNSTGVQKELRQTGEALIRKYPNLRPGVFGNGRGLVALGWSRSMEEWKYLRDWGPRGGGWREPAGVYSVSVSRLHAVLIETYCSGDLTDTGWGQRREEDHISVTTWVSKGIQLTHPAIGWIEGRKEYDLKDLRKLILGRSHTPELRDTVWFWNQPRGQLSALIAESASEALKWKPDQSLYEEEMRKTRVQQDAWLRQKKNPDEY